MHISDLNYVEALNTSEVVGGSYRGVKFDFKKDLDVDIDIDVRDKKYFDIYARVYGNSAVAEADAKAFGYDSSAEGFTFTYTDDYTSIAGSTSISVS
ncbi:MAG: hypothetical protein AAFV72_06885 [Cyanobacteria bacterium J06635_1]